jgi:hypothetical protein
VSADDVTLLPMDTPFETVAATLKTVPESSPTSQRSEGIRRFARTSHVLDDAVDARDQEAQRLLWYRDHGWNPYKDGEMDGLIDFITL